MPDPGAPIGAHGIAQIGITGVSAVVANAIHNAIRKRVRQLPITLDKLIGPQQAILTGILKISASLGTHILRWTVTSASNRKGHDASHANLGT
jgi:hypothetical protein